MEARQRTPKECLAVYGKHINQDFGQGKTELEEYLSKPIEDAELGDVAFNLTPASHHAVALAVLGMESEATRLLEWVERAAARVTAEGDGWTRWRHYEDLLFARWVLSASIETALLYQRAEAYPGDAEPDFRLSQAVRYLDAGMLQAGQSLIETIPVPIRRTKKWTPSLAVRRATQILSDGQHTQEDALRLREVLSDLRTRDFTSGLFLDVIPWVRLYNRLFVGESNPWTVVGWLKHNPVDSLPAYGAYQGGSTKSD